MIMPKTNPVFAVVVDGETEAWYLQMLKRNERHIRVSIKPEIPAKKSLEDQYKLVCELSDKEFLSICQNFEKSQKICKMGLPRLTKQIKLAHEG